MLVLFDHGTPAPLRLFLTEHTVRKTNELGWDTLDNGALLRAAEEAAFEVFLTTDKNIRYQQNLAERAIAIVVLGNSRADCATVRCSSRGGCKCCKARHLFRG